MKSFTARDHAFVFGVIAEAAQKASAESQNALVKSIIRYGNQRGARMAQTAKQFGDDASMQHYLAYGEWAPAPDEMDVRIVQRTPSEIWNVHKCPWKQEWEQADMLDVGKLYCTYVDAALVKGFNTDLKLGTGEIQTGGDAFCYFQWNGAEMTEEKLTENQAIREKVGFDRIRPWSYHLCHIYKTMREVLTEELGEERTDLIFADANQRIEEKYGKEVVEMLQTGLLLDYWVTPSKKNATLLLRILGD